MDLKPYYTALKRYHRSKGYGIHSPFAFNFTVKVLHERTPYYAYADIDRWRREAIDSARHRVRHPRIISAKHARLLFRVTCFFAPRAILVIGNTYGVSAMSMLRADTRARMVMYTGTMHDHFIFDKLTASCSGAITICPSIESAAECYRQSNADNPPYIVVNHLEANETETVGKIITDAIDSGGTVIMRNISKSQPVAAVWNNIDRSITHGMTFSNGRMGIIVGLKHLPRQSFSLWF